MDSILILTRKKTILVHFSELLKTGELRVLNSQGDKIFFKNVKNSILESFTLDQPEGKYWLIVNSDKMKIKKSFHLKY